MGTKTWSLAERRTTMIVGYAAVILVIVAFSCHHLVLYIHLDVSSMTIMLLHTSTKAVVVSGFHVVLHSQRTAIFIVFNRIQGIA